MLRIPEINKYFAIVSFPVFIISLHWISIMFYSSNCISPDFIGYLTSYLTLSSPFCTICLYIIEITSKIYFLTINFFTTKIINFLSSLSIDILQN